MTSILFRHFCTNNSPLAWSQEDSDRIGRDKNFFLTLKTGRRLPFLFFGEDTPEDSMLELPMEIPVGSKDLFWPPSQEFVQNSHKRSMYLYPFLIVPKYIFTFKPIMAVKFSAMYIFKRIFGEKNIRMIKQFLYMTCAYSTPGFQTLLQIAEQIWISGSLKDVPAILNKAFMDELVLCNFAEDKIPEAFPGIELDRPSLNAENFSLAKQRIIMDSIGKRNNTFDLDVLHEQLICLCCLFCCNDKEGYEKHIIACLQKYFTFENDLYGCSRCNVFSRSLDGLLLHIYTGCPINMRARCMYCNDTSPTCKCIGTRLIQGKTKELVQTKDRSNADLLKPDNIGMLVTFLEIRRMELVQSALEHENSVGCVTLEDPIAIDKGDICVFLKQINVRVYFYTKDQSLEFRTGFRDLLKFLGTDIHNFVDTFMAKWRDLISIDESALVAFEDLKLQDFCIYCLSWDKTDYHVRMFHPRCFCQKGPFRTLNDLFFHYAQHKVDRQCVFLGCTEFIEDVGHFVSHCRNSHKEGHKIFKIKCATDNPVKGCEAGLMEKSSQILHNLVYHVSGPSDLESFFNRSEILLSNLDGASEACVTIEDASDLVGDQENEQEQMDSEGDKDESKNDDEYESTDDDKESKDPKRSTKESVPNKGNNANKEDKINTKGDFGDKFICLSERCMKLNVEFRSQEELDRHIQLTHRCLYRGCDFVSLDDEVLTAHIHSHNKAAKGLQCKQCSVRCEDRLQLEQHYQSIHNHTCFVCKSSTFLSKTALDEHVKTCVKAPIDDRRDFLESNPEESPLECLIDLISKSKLEVDSSSLQAIKSASIKQNRLLKNPELHSSKTEVIFDLPIFPQDGGAGLPIPSGRLKSLPKFDPVDNNPMQNYLSMSGLIEEISYITVEFSSNEKTFTSLLLQQISSRAKLRMKSMLSGSQSLNSVRLETILDIARSLFFLISLKNIYIQASNLARPADESVVNYFSRLSNISRLASFYLGADQRQAWRDQNIKIQFLRQVSGQFRKTIEERENTLGCNFTPSELLKMYLTFRREYSNEVEAVQTLYRVQDEGVEGGCPWRKAQNQNKRRTLSYEKGRVRNLQDSNPRERLRRPPGPNRFGDRGEKSKVNNIGSRNEQKNQDKRRISSRTYELFKKIGKRPDFDRYFCLRCGKNHLSRYCRRYGSGPIDENVICSKCNLFHPECSDWN